MPTISQVFKADKTFKSPADLLAIAEQVVGKNKQQNIVLYCDSGRVASIWAFLLNGFGYNNTAVYDGSVQEYSKFSLEVSRK